MAQVLIYGDTPGTFATRLNDKLQDGKWHIVPGTHIAKWQHITGAGGSTAYVKSSDRGYFAVVVEEYRG